MAGVALAAAVTTTMGGAAATGRTAPPDPERTVHARPAVARDAAPATIDSDVYAYVNTPTLRAYFVVAGRLKLALVAGSSTRYTGTLLDYSGNKAYPAKANTTDPDAPVVTVTARNGTFSFTTNSSFGGSFYSGTGRTVPDTLGVPASQVTLGAASHQASSASYTYVLSERVGPASKKFEYTGRIAITHDANARISGGTFTYEKKDGRLVTTPLTGSGYYADGSYFYTTATIGSRTFGMSGTFTGAGGGFSGFAFTGSGAGASQWVLSGSPA